MQIPRSMLAARTCVLGVRAVRSTGRSAVITASRWRDGFMRARIRRPLQIVLITSMRQSSSSVSHCESIPRAPANSSRRPTCPRVGARCRECQSSARSQLAHGDPEYLLARHSQERAGITERLANMLSVSLGSKVVAAGSKLLEEGRDTAVNSWNLLVVWWDSTHDQWIKSRASRSLRRRAAPHRSAPLNT